MSLPPVDQPIQEEKRETKTWSLEEKQLFYEGFNKYYKRFYQIAEMIPNRSFTQVRQFFYRETKKIQGLLGASQQLVDWDDKDHVLCVFNSYSSIIRNGNDASKVMKSKKYIERLKHSLEKISKKQQTLENKKKQKETLQSRKDQKALTVSLAPTSTDSNVFVAADKSVTPISRSVSGNSNDWTVIRLIPATDMVGNALRSCRYCPLLELTVPTSLTVRGLINYLRTRWSRFCSNVRGVFKIFIASSTNSRIWIENKIKPTESEEAEIPSNIIPSTNSLMSNRMKDTPVNPGSNDYSYCNSILQTIQQIQTLTNCKDVLRLSYDYCIVSNSRRIRPFMLSSQIPSEIPSIYSKVVGIMQSTVFQCDLLGTEYSAEIKEVESVKEEKKKRRKRDPVKKQAKKVTPLENFDYSLPSPNSLCTSFTDVLPLINPNSNVPVKESAENNGFEEFPQPTQSTGPSFFSYIQTFNTNGWIDTKRPETDTTQDTPPPTSFNVPLSNENSILKTSFLPHSPLYTDTMAKDEKDKIPAGTNSKLSNLFNRMISPNSNSIMLNNTFESFQKDDSLCFPFTFESQG